MAITEVGAACAAALASAAHTAIDTYALPQPANLTTMTGVGPIIADACDGLVWARVGTVYPTDGSGAQFSSARPSWHIPAWCFPIELGVLWCHQNMTEDGGWIEPDTEHEYAERDGAYRLALMTAVVEGWRPLLPDPLAQVVMGQVIEPWTPIGPDGGLSGGILVVRVIAGALAYSD